MSASYENPFRGRPRPAGPHDDDGPNYADDPYSVPPSRPGAPYAGRATTHAAHTELRADGTPAHRPVDPYGETTGPTLEPQTRPDGPPVGRRGKVRSPSNAPIVPAGSVTGRSLTLVIAIMCFLACLTAGAVYMINQSADAWLKDLASEVTVQIEPKDGVATDQTIRDVTAVLETTSGIRSARTLAIEDTTKLLEPWLGKSDVLASLPVPRLIAVEIDRGSGLDTEALRRELAQKFQGVTLDDHRHWQRQIRTVTRSLALGGIAILILVAAATTAIIVSATKSSMASNREIVEVLHFVGATDRFIAREFEKHFLRLGIKAGFVGAALAGLVFLSMPAAMELLGGGPIMMAELHRLIGVGTLDTAGFVLLGIVVVIIAALCMLTSRLGVYRILNAKR